jgi:hypothetical protein
MKKYVTMLLIAASLSACTYNVSNAQTTGEGTDTIEDSATNTPTVSPDITIPVTPGAAVGI